MSSVNGFVLFLVLVLIGCSSSTGKEYRLTEEQLTNLMFDIQLAEVTLPDLIPEKGDSVKVIIDERLEEIYGLSTEELKKEMDQLQSDPEKLKRIVDKVKMMVDSIQ